MTLSKILLTYLLTTVAFFAIDIVWIGLVAKPFYQKHLAHFLSDQVNWVAALVFYLMYIAGILIFAVYPGAAKGSLWNAILLGGLFGLIAYATYDLTNMATLKNWPLIVTITDMLWGAVLTALVSGIGFYIVGWIGS